MLALAVTSVAAQATLPGRNGPLVIETAFYSSSCSAEDEYDVAALDPAQPKATPVLLGPDAENPVVSPDGTAIAYADYEVGHVAPLAHGRSSWTLNARRGGTATEPLAWSPDGRRLLVLHRPRPGRAGLAVIGSHGRLVSRLHPPDGFRFGPDAAWSVGGLLAVELLRGSGETQQELIALIGNAGAGPTVLLHHQVDAGVDWSPDGRTLAWSLHGRVYAAGRFGRDRGVRLMDGTGPAWSPDGTQIAAVLDGPRSDDRVMIRRADGRKRVLLPGWRGFEFTPDAILRVRWAPAALARFAFKRARAAC